MTASEEVIANKLGIVLKELEGLGLECAFFWRCPDGAKEPVAYFLVGNSYRDVEKAIKQS